MKKGDLYLKHVRGSRYGFNCNKLFYKYPGGTKNYAIDDRLDFIADLCEVKQISSGRVIINEEKEIVVYRQQDDYTWRPFYIGQLDGEIEFDGINNNPEKLMPGLLWTGFASNHGSKFHLDQKDHIYFQETYYEDGAQIKKKYYVKNPGENLIDSLYYFKQGPGSFHINEYGHIWAAVEKEVITECYHTDLIDVSDIMEQFKHLTTVQKRTIQKYTMSRFNQLTKKNESWYPIYIGKYTNLLKISREERPHTIIDIDKFFSE